MMDETQIVKVLDMCSACSVEEAQMIGAFLVRQAKMKPKLGRRPKKSEPPPTPPWNEQDERGG